MPCEAVKEEMKNPRHHLNLIYTGPLDLNYENFVKFRYTAAMNLEPYSWITTTPDC